MIKIDHISFSYGEENENTGGVRDIDLNIEDGQFVVLCGESGCGKTTVTRLINGLIPHYYEGKMTGEVWVNGAKVSEQPLYDTAAVVGSVFQNPRSQFFNVDTTSEITFGCENLGQPEKDIRERLAKTVRDFRLEKLMDRNIFHLSGGEKQKIACAGVSIMEPDVLVMDEPSSNLDAASILDLRKILAFWKSQGKTIIVSEHRLYYLRGLADRFIYLADGQVSHDYSAAEQYHRNFDLGVSQAEHPEVFSGISSENEGRKLVSGCVKYLADQKKSYLIPDFLIKCAARYIGYHKGLNYRKMSPRAILRATMNPYYFERYWDRTRIPADVHAGYGKNKEGL